MKRIVFKILILLTMLNQNILIDSAHAQVETAASAAGSTSGMDIDKLFDSPMGVAIIAGIATVYSGILYKAAAKQEEESNANVVKIDKMIASFKDSYAGYCPKGRDSLADAKCYCYSNDGTKNATRTNSQTCIDLWAKNSYKISGDAGNYNLAAYNPDVAGCVAVDGQFDENCKCKKMLNAKGENACKKETAITMPADAFSTGLATGGGLADVLKYSANSGNGNPRFDLISNASLGAKAIRAKQITDALTSKIPLLNGQKVPNINESNVGKYANAVLGEKNIAAQARSGSGAMNVASNRSDNPAMTNLLKAAQAKVGIDVMGSGKGLGSTKEKKKAFELNLGGDGGNSGGQVLGNFPEEKNYKFKNSDIVTDNSASIFDIISNRYIQSGLKRLFDDEAK